MSSTMRFAVFGDLHGRILLAFWLVKRWQDEHGEKIDHILCVGDVGVFRCLAHMDKASRRYAVKYPEELGFSKFFWNANTNISLGNQKNQRNLENPEAIRLEKTVKLIPHPLTNDILKDSGCNLYFVPGNHEDHQFIRNIRKTIANDIKLPVAVDIDWEGEVNGLYSKGEFCGYGKILCLPEGPIVKLDSSISEKDGKPKFSVTLRAINGLDKYTQIEAWKAPKPGIIDILLTHEAPNCRYKGFDPYGGMDSWGSEKLSKLIIKLSPRYHFFGHYHRYFPGKIIECNFGNLTHSVGLNQLFFETKNSVITQGAFGILKILNENSKEYKFSIVDDVWYNNLRFSDVAHVI